MSIDLRRLISDVSNDLVKPLEVGNLITDKIQDEISQKDIDFGNFNRDFVGDFNEIFASRTGLSTNLNPLTLRLRNDSSPPSDKEFDGFFVGANGQTFEADTTLNDIPAVTPQGGVRNNETLIYVNGIQTDVAGQSQSLQAIADNSGSRVVGIHNSTGSIFGDLLQSLGDKLDIGKNPAVDTLADTVYDELTTGRDVHLMAHSQGAIITSRALTDVKNRLMLEDGMSRSEAENLLNNVKVETFGGASRRYPDGPQYVHYVNRNDGVPQSFGLRSWLNPFAHAGSDAVTHYFREGKPLISHGFEKFYLPERVPFEQARAGRFD